MVWRKIGTFWLLLDAKTKWSIAWSVIVIFFFALFAHRAWFIPESDYVAYYNAGARALAGTNLYVPDPTPFKYLPVVSYFFMPFSLLAFRISKVAFFIVSFAAGVLVYLRIRRRLGNWVALAALLGMIRFHNYDFLNSQVNHVLLLLFVLFLDYRRSSPRLATFLFSVLASFKVVPLMILAPLCFMWRLREAGWILTWFIILSFIPIATFGDGIGIYSNWFELMRSTTEFPAPSSAILQSIQGALWYWIGSVFFHAGYFSVFCHAIMSVLLGSLCFFAVRSETHNDERRVLAACIVLAVVISPLAWKHNYLLILPALVLLLEHKQYRPAGAAFFLMTLCPAVIGLFSKHWADRSYTTLIGAMIIFGSLFSTLMPRIALSGPAYLDPDSG